MKKKAKNLQKSKTKQIKTSFIKKHKKKLQIIGILLALLVIVFLSVFIIHEKTKPSLSISYISVPESLSKAFSKIVDNNKDNPKQKIEEIYLNEYPNNKKSLKKLLKTDIILTKTGTIPKEILSNSTR